MENDFLFGTDLQHKWDEVFTTQKAPPAGSIINTNYDSKLYDHILTIYPEMKAGLELCCGGGRRIRGGRSAMKNIFGINDRELSMMWKLNGVEDFCKVGTVDDIPYKDNTFDFICYPDPLKNNKKGLREIKRVGYGRWYLKLGEDLSDSEWIQLLTDEGFYIDIFHKSDKDFFVSEGKFLKGDI